MRLTATILFLVSFAAGQQAPATFEDLSAKAEQAYNANHLQEAADLYSQAVKLKPDWAQGWWALGMIQYQDDHYPECRDALRKMVALDAAAAPGWALLGLCEFGTKQYDESFEHLKKMHMLVSVRESGGQLLDIADYHLALLLTRQGAFEVAQEVMLRVALKVRTNSDMMFASGLMGLRMPILPADVPPDHRDVVSMAGKTFWDLATQPPEQSEADFKDLVAKYPNFPNVHYYYGTFLAARHPEQCIPEFLSELRVSPDNVPARVQLVLRYIVEQKLDDALKYAREAVQLSPDSVGSQLALAETLRARGDNEAALAVFLKAEQIDPVSPKIRLYLVNTYRSLGRIDDMKRENAEYQQLKADQPNWP